ncbi:Chitotriosidase-1 [Fusarium oxysporum f. sp. albedinis]|nr:Chitotriosidase-1 [Fusarium oxysporum f. sp. albedinis]
MSVLCHNSRLTAYSRQLARSLTIILPCLTTTPPCPALDQGRKLTAFKTQTAQFTDDYSLMHQPMCHIHIGAS